MLKQYKCNQYLYNEVLFSVRLVIGTIFTVELNSFTVPQSTHFSYFVVVSLQGAILGFNENRKDTLRIEVRRGDIKICRKVLKTPLGRMCLH